MANAKQLNQGHSIYICVIGNLNSDRNVNDISFHCNLHLADCTIKIYEVTPNIESQV